MRANRSWARWGAGIAAASAVLVFAALPATFAAAADPADAGVDFSGTGGCSGAAVSKDAAGEILGVLKGDLAASPDDALPVVRGGTVEYQGRSQQLMTDNEWSVAIGGVPVKSDTGANAGEKRQTSGTAQVDDYLPVDLTGTMKVNVAIDAGDGTDCTVVSWISVDGNGLTSLNGLVGLGLLALGLIGLALSLPAMSADGLPKTHGIRGTVFGLLAGFGVAMLLVSTSVIVVGSPWLVLGVTAAGAVLGGLLVKILPTRGDSATAS
jgi:hypothetical protein